MGQKGASAPPACYLREQREQKCPFLEMQKNAFQTLIWYNGDTVSYINKQYMIEERYIYMIVRNIALC